MTACIPNSKTKDRGKWFFLGVFIFACFLFWWAPSILFRLIFHQADSVEDGIIGISVLALVCFIVGYILPTFFRPGRQFSEATLDVCGNCAYRSTIVFFIPALLASMHLWYIRVGFVYGSAGPIPRPYQALFYIHLFFGFMCLGAADPDKQGWRRILITSTILALPRLIVSLHGGRFFLAQAVVPAILIAVARGWIHFSFNRVLQILALAMAIILVPSMTRGDDVIGQDESVNFFAAGSSLLLFQDNTDLNLSGRCPPFLVSITAKMIPYGLMGVCVLDFSDLKNMPATLDRILTINDPLSFNGTVSGTGSNYLLELYLSGGLLAVYAGSALFGLTCREFVGWIGKRSLFSGIWAECLTRSLFSRHATT